MSIICSLYLNCSIDQHGTINCSPPYISESEKLTQLNSVRVYGYPVRVRCRVKVRVRVQGQDCVANA